MDKRYEDDFYGWAVAQADALRRRSANEVDWDNIAEEMDGLSRSEARELRSRLAVLLTHLLKWLVQPERRSRSWRLTIDGQREAIEEHLAENPSLRPRAEESFRKAWTAARRQAALEMDVDLEDVPATAPFDLAHALDPAFWPEPPSA